MATDIVMEKKATEKKWYVLRVISGKERKVREYLEFEISRSGWEHAICKILVPTEKVYKIVKGKKVIKDRNLYPGYIYIEVDEKTLTQDMLQTIRTSPNVLNFIGGRSPEAIRQVEVQRLLGKVDEMSEAGEMMNEPFIIEETVKIIDGPFNEFMGTIEEIYEEKKKLKVIVKIFGRRTPVEVGFVQVEKVS